MGHQHKSNNPMRKHKHMMNGWNVEGIKTNGGSLKLVKEQAKVKSRKHAKREIDEALLEFGY